VGIQTTLGRAQPVTRECAVYVGLFQRRAEGLSRTREIADIYCWVHLSWRTARRLVPSIAALVVVACGTDAGVGPTSPGAGANAVIAVDVSCPSTVLIGEQVPCVSVARMRSGQQPVVAFQSAWSSMRPDIVVVDTLGVLTGRSAGQTIVSASYEGREGTALVTVTAEDAVRIRAAPYQGEFRAGTTATMWLQGYYSVASAETGRLSLRISDQFGTIATTSPTIVARGGNFFLLSSTFVVPQASTRVCRAVILEVGSVTIAEPQPSANVFSCIDIRP
jgi:hypothetical protein